MWARYLEALKRYPVATNATTAFGINTIGDVLAQNMEHRSLLSTANQKQQHQHEHNWKRTWSVASFGMLAAGPAVYWFRWLDRTFPLGAYHNNKFSPRALSTLAQKLTVHLGLFAPTMNASFYGWIILQNRYQNQAWDWKHSQESILLLRAPSLLSGSPLALSYDAAPQSFWQEWYTKLEKDLWETQMNSLKVWGTAQTFNFMVLPSHLRVLFSNVVMVAWTAYLSVMGHRQKDNNNAARRTK